MTISGNLSQSALAWTVSERLALQFECRSRRIHARIQLGPEEKSRVFGGNAAAQGAVSAARKSGSVTTLALSKRGLAGNLASAVGPGNQLNALFILCLARRFVTGRGIGRARRQKENN